MLSKHLGTTNTRIFFFLQMTGNIYNFVARFSTI